MLTVDSVSLTGRLCSGIISRLSAHIFSIAAVLILSKF